jgi:hypothetical protein
MKPEAPSSSARALAARHRAALRRRARTIRRSVGAITVALFLVAFVWIYVQLAAGHDPALSASKNSAGTKSSSAGRESGSSRTDPGSTGRKSGSSATLSGSPGSESSGESSSPSSVTTAQS